MGKKKERSSFWKDFKAFITRGNVLDLAIGVVVGGAFGKITTGLVNYIISPLIGMLVGGMDMAEWKWVLREEVLDAEGEILENEVAVLYGSFLQTILDFLIIAFSIFVVVRILQNTRKRLHARELAAEAAAAEEQKRLDAEAAEAAKKKAEEEAELELSVKRAILDIQAMLKEKQA